MLRLRLGSMFSSTTCGYCANAKRLLSKHTGDVMVLEVNELGAWLAAVRHARGSVDPKC